jgi:predicted transcriptional regulator
MTENTSDLIGLTSDIVSSMVSNNKVATADLPGLISSVYAALAKTAEPAVIETPALVPAVPIRHSVKHDYIVCLEDGAKLKMLKRYLRTNYHMTPDEYRAKWGLPKTYPMVSGAYAETRRTLAKKIGLGRKPAAAVATAVEAVKAPVKRAGKALGIVAAKAAAAAHLGTDKPATAKRGRPAKAKADTAATAPTEA